MTREPIFALVRKAPRRTRLLAGAALALALVGFTPAPVHGPFSMAAGAQTATPNDLRALIYYLDQNDQAAVQAEMRRLRTAFPDWRPPSDLNDLRAPAPASGPSVDEAAIWARIERGDFAGARNLIEQGRAAAGGWQPDAEMLRVLDLNETQAAFDRAVSGRNAPEAIAIARRAPQMFRCDRINNAWQLAEMYALVNQPGNAVSTYQGVATSCTALSDQAPTLEKADAVASPAQLAGLFDAARGAAPGNTTALNQLEARLRAGRGGAPAAAQPAAQSAAPAPARVAAAPAPAPTPAPVQAAVQTATQAPATDYARLPLRGDGRIGTVRAAKEAGAWGRCLATSANPQSLEVLYERGWCAYSHDRPAEALAAFAAVARAGSGLGPEVQRDANFGLSLSYLGMNMTDQAAAVSAATPLTATQRRDTETIILDQRAVRAFRLGEHRQAIAYLNALEQQNGSLRRDLAILRAYSYLENDQRAVAYEQFQTLHAQLATDETRDGLNASR
ncbi:hypothetical protein [Roseicitreum antarcticum]|uniref:Tetratricopeptide repeat-containing protein n=1 Tax=Roseicitreum antarcticum TaxID=564137 RepID=A0A1H2XTM9_9RHOB|nr:hypothetical protein [Roseicitreum antarcticum]SDW96206.1 hypothetical protein SAMN04488238_104309 [Roseicitreum antarcticum]